MAEIQRCVFVKNLVFLNDYMKAIRRANSNRYTREHFKLGNIKTQVLIKMVEDGFAKISGIQQKSNTEYCKINVGKYKFHIVINKTWRNRIYNVLSNGDNVQQSCFKNSSSANEIIGNDVGTKIFDSLNVRTLNCPSIDSAPKERYFNELNILDAKEILLRYISNEIKIYI